MWIWLNGFLCQNPKIKFAHELQTVFKCHNLMEFDLKINLDASLGCQMSALCDLNFIINVTQTKILFVLTNYKILINNFNLSKYKVKLYSYDQKFEKFALKGEKVSQ